MSGTNGGPTKAELNQLRAELQPGQQRRVSNGIYARRYADGTLKFQLRLWDGSGSERRYLAATFTRWSEADRTRREWLDVKEHGNDPAPKAKLGFMSVTDFARQEWWLKHVEDECGDTTKVDYLRVLENDVLPFLGNKQIGRLNEQDARDFKAWLKVEKSKPLGPRGKPGFRIAAADRAYRIARRVVLYAVKRNALLHDPWAGVGGFTVGTHRDKDKTKPRQRAVSREEIFSVCQIERARLALVGRPLEVLMWRALISVLAYLGLRPGEAASLRNRDWLSPDGLKRHLHIDSAVKDVAGVLIDGPTKNRYSRDPLPLVCPYAPASNRRAPALES